MKIELSEEEVTALIEALGTWMEEPNLTNEEWLKRQDIGADLDMDLREAWARKNDGWPGAADAEINAETQMIDAGEKAREQVKMSRRNERLMQGTTATLANDPVDW